MLQQYAPRGTDLYYILRQVRGHARAAYLALSAFCLELNRTAERYTEPQIAEKKLAWFAEEVEQFFQGKARHPFFEPLSEFQEHLSKTALLALVEAHVASLHTHVFETRVDLFQHYQHLGGIRLSLLAKLLGTRSMEMETHVHELGVVDEMLRHLRDFRIFLGRQHLYFALEDFQNLKIDPSPILQLKDIETLIPLFEEYFHFAKTRFYDIQTHFQGPGMKPLRLEVLLKLKQAERMHRNAWPFLKVQLELSPLRKLFLTSF